MDFRAFASSSAGNLYLATEEGCRPLLIEAGVKMRDIRRVLPMSVTALEGCLVSHNHVDHSCAVPDLLGASVDVYASSGCWEALGLAGHRAHEIDPMREFRAGRWRVMPFDLRHDAEGSLGFLIGAPGGDRLLFACDTAYVPYRFDGLTHIAIECNYSADLLLSARGSTNEHKARILRSHMSLERVLTLLDANDLSRVREIHLMHLSDGHSNAIEFKAAVEAATGKPVQVAPRNLTARQREAR